MKRASLGEKIVGGLLSAVSEHFFEGSPELKRLAEASGYTHALPPSRVRATAKKAVANAAKNLEAAIGAGIEAAGESLRAKAKRKKIERAKVDKPDEVIMLVKKKDGSYGKP